MNNQPTGSAAMKPLILRVLGINSSRPAVLAKVITDSNTVLVRWDPRGWSCDCSDEDCDHVDAVAELLDPRVTGEQQQ